MEIVGFKVDQVYVLKWLKRYVKKDPKLDLQVIEFLRNKADYVKAKAVAQYNNSRNPIEKLEYKLNLLIGPNKLKDRIKVAHGHA